jgi:hypothetical protein
MSHTQSFVKHRIAAAAVATVVATALAACGGGNSGVDDKLAGQGVAVGEPNGALPIAADFIAKAQEAACADTRNRLFMIDKTMVFWDRAGSCVDNTYSRTLYGATPQALLCTLADSIAGAQITCADARSRALFDTIVAHLDRADLGLGGGHQVEALAIPVKPH